MHPKSERLIPIVIGFFAFLVVTGGTILLPSNIAWLDHGDPRQHYLGWAFFRQGDWQFPLGLNPGFGLEIGSSIAFSDSLPLLAIPFKALDPLLPPVFQYFGLWVFACFLLQAVMGWKLGGLITTDRLLRSLMTGFFVFAPPMLWRLHGHLSLFGHFLILAALYLSLASRERRRALPFFLLVTISAAVHAYLLAMVAAIWLASLADGLWNRAIAWRSALSEAVCTLLLTGLVCWQVGYFAGGGGAETDGYGIYRMNLLSPIDPDGWSRILPDIPGGPGDYEGFNFLGLGLLIVAVMTLPALWRGRGRIFSFVAAAPFSILVAIALTLFAVSNTIGLAGWTVTVPLPAFIERLANVLRSSGRMFWPVHYALLTAILFLAVHGLRAARARALLAVALLVQVADTSAGWTFRAAQLRSQPASTFATPMRDPFWSHAADRYDAVRWMMPMNHSPQWSVIADYAARSGMETDAAFLARVGTQALADARAAAADRLARGDFDIDSLYLLDSESARAAGIVLRPSDMLATIDGFTVLAPGWRECADCPQGYTQSAALNLGSLRGGEDIAFSGPESETYRLGGWGQPEEWGVWSSADIARIGFADPLPARFRLVIEAQAFGPNVDAPFLFSAGAEPTPARIGADRGTVALEMAAAPGARVIEIAVPNAVSPQELGINDDVRRLGIGLARFRIEPLP